MSGAEVLYSAVNFTRWKREADEADTTYAEVRISKARRPTAELPECLQQLRLSGRSKVTSERVALLVLSALLAAAVAALCVTTSENVRTRKTLEDLRQKWESEKMNLSEKSGSTVQVKNEPCYKCEEGWEQHGGKCYHFSISKSSWEESRAGCRAKGGHLVKIDSREEQRFLLQRLRDLMKDDEDKFWIGLTDSAADSRWVWVDDSPLNKSLAYWRDNEPDNWPQEDCVRMGSIRDAARYLRSWCDTVCKLPQRSICEKLAGNGQFKPACV